MLAAPAAASAPTAVSESGGARDYLAGRAAELLESPAEAARRYAAAMVAEPGNPTLAGRALSQAIAAGDRPRALAAAERLDAVGKLSSEAQLLLFAEAVRGAKWNDAARRAAELRSDPLLGELAPLLEPWVEFGRRGRRGKPAQGKTEGLATNFAAENRALLLLAGGRAKEGLAVLEPALTNNPRADRLRVIAAGHLARAGDKEDARRLLAGDDYLLQRARRLLDAGELPARSRANENVADLLGNLSVMLTSMANEGAAREGSPFARFAEALRPLARSLAMIGSFAAPGDPNAAYLAGSILAAGGDQRGAAALFATVPPAGLYGPTALDAHVSALIAVEDKERGLAEALAATKRADAAGDDWSRLGDAHAALERWGDAADAYAKALALTHDARWSLHLQHGAALVEAGRWPEAKRALQEAVRRGPEEPIALNFLGYSMLERREDVAEAARLIAKASALRPHEPSITDSLGWAYYIRGDLAQAIPTLERAVRGEPGAPDINEHLGDAYWTAGRRAEARFAWSAALVGAEGEDRTRVLRKLDTGLTPEVAAP